MHFIGIDIGTTSICGVIYDALNRKTESLNVENESGIDAGNSWQKMQDPQWIVTCVMQIIKNLNRSTETLRDRSNRANAWDCLSG